MYAFTEALVMMLSPAFKCGLAAFAMKKNLVCIID